MQACWSHCVKTAVFSGIHSQRGIQRSKNRLASDLPVFFCYRAGTRARTALSGVQLFPGTRAIPGCFFFAPGKTNPDCPQSKTRLRLSRSFAIRTGLKLSPELISVCQQIEKYIGYEGHRIEVPDGLLTWFFRAIANEYYLFWQDTENPCRIETKTMRLMLKPQLGSDGLSFDVMLGREGKPPLLHPQE